MSVRRWSDRSLGNLRGIHPDLRRVMDRALADSPLDFVVIEGLRTRERQAEMVRSGASRTMNSRHLTGHAVDLMPIDPETGRGSFAWPLYHRLGPAVKEAAAAEKVSITWGGDWSRFPDGPHFELSWHDYPADAPWPQPGATVQAVAAPAPQPAPPPMAPREPLSPPPIWATFIAAVARLFRRD